MGYQNVERVFDIPKALINPATRLTLLSLAEHANDKTNLAWPGNSDFVRRTSLDRSTIWRALAACEKQGVLEVTPPYTGANKKVSNLYEIKWQVVDERVEAGLLIGPSSRTRQPVSEDDPSPSTTTPRRTQRPARRPVQRAGRTTQQGGRAARPKPEEPETNQSQNSEGKKSSLAAGSAAGARPRQRPRLRKKEAGLNSTGDLVTYFRSEVEEQARRRAVKLLDPVNEKGLGGQINRWMADGVSSQEVRAMMDHFLDGELPTRAPVWKVFADSRSKLLQKVRDIGLPSDQQHAGVKRYGGDYYEDD